MRISAKVKITYEEASKILGFDVESKVEYIESPSKKHTDYTFSMEDLEIMVELLEGIFAEKAMEMHELIQKYFKSNKNLKEYSRQRHNVGKPHYFSEILSGEFEKAYLFGFIGHDGSLNKVTKQIRVKIHPKDHIILYKLAKAIDLDLSKTKIQYGKQPQIYKGQLKKYYYATLAFGCKPMNKELKELGDIGSGSETKEVPLAIRELVRKAKQKSLDEWMYTEEGQTALAWLLGAYDADGSISGGNAGMFFSSIEEYLYEIKELFGLKNKVLEMLKPGTEVEIFDRVSVSKGSYSVRISSKDVFVEMMNSYPKSFKRKRPQQDTSGESNYLGELN